MPDNNSSGERTENATPKKRKDAREQGQVLKSIELITAGSLLVMFGAMKALLSLVGDSLENFTIGYLDGSRMTSVLNAANVMGIMQTAVYGFLLAVLPVLAIALLVGVGLNVMQVGFFFSTKALGFKMERLNPAEGFKRMFSARTVFELLKTLLKVGLVLLVLYTEIKSNETAFTMLMTSGIQASVVQGGNIVLNAALKASGVLAAIAVLDYFFQRRKFEKDLMMTKYEVKMEYKQQEGDPLIKGQIRQKQRQMAMMRMMQNVPEADVVITNPTHFAVALSYKEKEAEAPKVVAKGKDLVAQRIKEVAREHGVEIVENRELAQTLFRYCEVGDLIPASLFQAVAEILAYVYRLKNKDKDYRRR
jgi:flagellar biosynthetic protein FlhB